MPNTSFYADGPVTVSTETVTSDQETSVNPGITASTVSAPTSFYADGGVTDPGFTTGLEVGMSLSGGAANRILYDNGGALEELTLGTNLSITSGVLNATGGGGTPGGTNGQVQINSSGSFAGSPMDYNVTLASAWTIKDTVSPLLQLTNSNPGGNRAQIVLGGPASSSQSSTLGTDKNNDNGTNFYILNGSTLLMDWNFTTTNAWTIPSAYGLINPGGTLTQTGASGVALGYNSANLITLGKSASIGWEAVAQSGTPDFQLYEDGGSTNTLALGSGTTPLAFHIYNTTDQTGTGTTPSNSEGITLNWTSTSNVATLKTFASGTGIVRDFNLYSGDAGTGSGVTFSNANATITFKAGGTNVGDYNIVTASKWTLQNGLFVDGGDFNVNDGYASQGGGNNFTYWDSAIVGWSSASSVNSSSTADTAFSRTAAGVLALGNGTASNIAGTLYTTYFATAQGGGGAASGSAPGLTVSITGDTTSRLGCSLDTSNNPLLSFGSGSATRDTAFSRTAAGTLALGNGTQASVTGVLKLSQVNLAAGAATVAPIVLTSGTNLTTAAAGAIEFDGNAFYATAKASSRQAVDAEQFQTLTSAHTLTSQTAAQKIFNATANGTITVAGSTTYFFECLISLTSLSATNSIFGFAFGGTATFTAQAWWAEASNPTTSLATAGVSPVLTYNTAANVALTSGTPTSGLGIARIWGKLRINAAGTLIPEVSLNTAAAAIVGVDSYFRIWAVGSNAVTNVGDWS